MALSTVCPLPCRPSLRALQFLRPSSSGTSSHPPFHGHWDSKCFYLSPLSICWHHLPIVAYSGGNDSVETERMEAGLLEDDLLRRIVGKKDAQEAIEMIAEAKKNVSGGIVGINDCRLIIAAAFDGKNVELALSVFHAMLSGRAQGMNEVKTLERWGWARPDVQIYALLVRGLAASLRVADALRIIGLVSGAGVASGDEVPFGMIVQCPICMLAIAVAQPQHGVQIASCSNCRYQYELVSGDIHSITSEVTSMDTSAWEKTLRFLRVKRDSPPAAIHSVVVRTPSGIACTNKFATKTVKLPAQGGERVTIVLAAPANIYQEIGPLKLSAKPPELRPGEPMSLTNHTTGQVSQLVRAPLREEYSFLSNPSLLFTSLAVLASGDAASGFIDPSLPRLISVVAVASLAVGATVSRVILPQLSKLPQRMVDVINLKQQLLSQYDLLKSRIKDLRHDTEKEVWMLARMCQLENKIIAVGEPSYRARRARVKKVCESLEKSISARIELIDSYAKISSMIEIEVEMDSDVLVAEAISNAESIAKQIQQIMEIENLEERWRIQAEANDEVERLLNAPQTSTEQL
ncbi:uncharacterized protein LOC110024564 isoform X1 [Phalaenopsis equestris]|uniref:uncharacterized protein LOC110024564 isoform X1 n=1 Tax=Phalaenopsis equestris TaxID=78828 RepID=UPI0009E33BB8|nr:uncharacterized protein LOC110024564 isoform X1 [Phalaenopsis equestris]XP_020580266.1 uncharacterized protein LOC110024564 isoform X1 [Phalaenopsis equestris]XP_020580267.1 uncharacterized protein LOC110024564 isoform X1 [Phalaenopsis equestris]